VGRGRRRRPGSRGDSRVDEGPVKGGLNALVGLVPCRRPSWLWAIARRVGDTTDGWKQFNLGATAHSDSVGRALLWMQDGDCVVPLRRRREAGRNAKAAANGRSRRSRDRARVDSTAKGRTY